MFPSLVMHDVMNSRHARVKLRAQFRKGDTFSVAFANLYHLRFAELGIVTILASALSLLAHHIGTIIRLCAKKEVGRIDTRRIVARMTNHKSVRDWANVYFMADSMRQVSFLAEREDSVAARKCALPNPTIAIASRLNLVPKGFFDGVCRHSMPIVAVNEFQGYALNLLAFWSVAVGKGRLLPTTAMAITVGNIVRGIMGLHKNLLILVPRPWTVPAVAGLLLLVATPVIIPQEAS